MKPKARCLLWDCETMPNIGAIWGKYEQNVLWYEQEGYMFCFAYKWLGERSYHVVSLADFPLYKKDPRDDSKLIKALYKLFQEADIIIAHNGDSFDQKVANGRFLKYGFPPPPSHKQIDTLKVARKYFRLNSNKLDDLGEFLGVGRKERTGGIDLWYDVYHGVAKAIKKMTSYNIQDVRLLEAVYLKLRPWIDNHPAINLLNQDMNACPKCGKGPLVKEGKRLRKSSVIQEYSCKNCGGWCHARVAEKTLAKPVYVN